MQSKGRSAAVELESYVAHPGEGAPPAIGTIPESRRRTSLRPRVPHLVAPVVVDKAGGGRCSFVRGCRHITMGTGNHEAGDVDDRENNLSNNRRRGSVERKGLSLAEIQEIPKNSLLLLLGPPGAGKSTFCHQIVLNGIAADRPIIFVTTEQSPSGVKGLLRESGMGEPPPGALSFVDAFAKTVGLVTPERPDTIDGNCKDLNSISVAIARQQEKIGKRDILLAFDSLTSPYLFNDKEAFRFMRFCLLKFASQENSVLALVDEGCGKEEDLGAMMRVADRIIKMEVKEGSRITAVFSSSLAFLSSLSYPLPCTSLWVRILLAASRSTFLSLSVRQSIPASSAVNCSIRLVRFYLLWPRETKLA
ncbi:MAG: hypothetical protein E3J81_08905 [Dehalococcoidia bacterium]|nr:MAG: hypothetical protein E3J81_08905 [Dehalococcoidia bacterium]